MVQMSASRVDGSFSALPGSFAAVLCLLESFLSTLLEEHSWNQTVAIVARVHLLFVDLGEKHYRCANKVTQGLATAGRPFADLKATHQSGQQAAS